MMNLGNDKALWLLFVVPVALIPVYVWCFWRKAVALRVLATNEMLKHINASVSLKKQIFKSVLLVLGFVSVVAALTEPRWNPKPQRLKSRGRDIAILLDTSRSMLAEDIRPNRLERAKIAVGDLLDKLAGDRIALITFAGNSTIKCPLTQDYAFLRMVLADVGTESTSRGGTMIGDAIRKATDEVFDKHQRQYKDIILITDGDDQDSFPVQAAEQAGAEGVRIIAIGLGNETEGARIPITGPSGEKTFLKYKDQEVWSKLNGDMLRKLVYATDGGKYLPVETGTFNLDEVYAQLSAEAQKRQLESMTMMKYDERFQVFLVLGILLIALEALISERKKI